uniref:Glycosyltransferase n=1 Tax=Rubia yunnanensis TaxID=1650721 RepID=A0A896AUK8_9GENT|nr:glycosyltransferase [Rubia yunnanensis]
MATETKKHHVAVVPWLAFGHMIPFLELAKSIAQRGHRVSFISTPGNLHRLPNIPSHQTYDLNILKFPLPRVHGLPESAEATNDVPMNKVHFLKKAYDEFETEVASFLESSRPDWLIYDFASHKLPSVGAKLGISLAFFSTSNGWSGAFFGPPSRAHERTKPEDFTIQPPWIPFPCKLAFRRHEIERMFDGAGENASGVSDWERFCMSLGGCDVVLIRSCSELESEFLQLVREVLQKPVIPVGFLPQSAIKETDSDEAWKTISGWLHGHLKGSVLYVALGTEVQPTQDELTELATGLELSGLPFFWTMRKRDPPPELPTGFEERVRGRGIVWTSWVPQAKILSHDSVGGFLTHCGWGSIIEGLQQGRPLVMLPFQAEQGLNARVLEAKTVGVEVPRTVEDGSLSRDSIAEAVKLIMEDERGQAYRGKAGEMKNKIFGNRDLQEKYKDDLVEYLEKFKRPV